MSRIPQLSPTEKAEDLLWEDVRIKAVYHPDGPKSRIPYFEVEVDDELVRVRFRMDNLELKEWLEQHVDRPIDLTVYAWHYHIGESSGIVYYFRRGEPRKES